jgi:hypothetical protein
MRGVADLSGVEWLDLKKIKPESDERVLVRRDVWAENVAYCWYNVEEDAFVCVYGNTFIDGRYWLRLIF